MKIILLVAHFRHYIVSKEVPKLEADLEQFFISYAAHLSKVRQTLQSLVSQHLDFIVRLNASCNDLDKVEIIFEN